MFYDFDLLIQLLNGTKRAQLPEGRLVPVFLADLTTEVRLCPGSPAWRTDAVAGLTSKLFRFADQT